MLNVKKFILVIIAVMLVSLVFGNINSYATTVRTITANTSASNTNSNTAEETNKEDNQSPNTNTNTNTTRTITSSSDYSNTNSNKNTTSNSSSLPYTGTKSSVVFVGIAFVVSAVYAYKKVSEYKNI